MPETPIQFVSGLPRSGSTLLLNILGQNPNHHVTPTSAVVEHFANTQRDWQQLDLWRSQGLDKVKPFALNMLRGIFNFYSDQFDRGMTVFDKSRSWLTYIEDLERCLKREVTIIVTIRDIRSILASFEKLYRRRDIEYRYPLGEMYYKAQTTEGRCDFLLREDQVLGLSINRVRDAIRRLPKKIHFVSYGALCEDPIGELKKLHKAIGVKWFKKYNPDKVKQITKEDDNYHGLDLHKIRGKITPGDETDWSKILQKDYAEKILQQYWDIEVKAQQHNKPK